MIFIICCRIFIYVRGGYLFILEDIFYEISIYTMEILWNATCFVLYDIYFI